MHIYYMEQVTNRKIAQFCKN